MQMPAIIKPTFISVSPIHQWPESLKTTILTSAIILCLAVYAALMLGLVALAILTVNAVTG